MFVTVCLFLQFVLSVNMTVLYEFINVFAHCFLKEVSLIKDYVLFCLHVLADYGS